MMQMQHMSKCLDTGMLGSDAAESGKPVEQCNRSCLGTPLQEVSRMSREAQAFVLSTSCKTSV